ncbi:MAG TPA: hypothetical protein DCY88_29015 [Cyanobacteria bacterium UBA11372]|nr:hypothetical protein [Cyanobacteria bacterium UBA11372]
MKVLFNRQLITQTLFDSGALSALGSIIHNFSEPGEYYGTILRETQTEGSFRLTVDENSPTMQVKIDLAKLTPESQFVINPKGYTVFYVSSGAGGYAVVASKINPESASILFDSRELKEGDLLAVTLIRPGTYSVTNVNNGTKGEIVVSLPAREATTFRPSGTVSIECTENGFVPDKIAIESTQGQIYSFRTPSRILIELVTPDDSSTGLRATDETASQQKVVRWRKPLPPNG